MPPQHGFKHSHVKAGGGTHSHTHSGSKDHGHGKDSKDNTSGVALLPIANSGTSGTKAAETFALDWGFKADTTITGDLILTGYGNTWELDRDGEKTARGAFDDSLADYLSLNPIVCLEHDRQRVMGFVRKAITDDVGLRVEAVIPKPDPGSEPWHIKAYNDIKRGTLRTFSMGGRFVKDVSRGIIEKVNLFEISVVGIPANPISVFEVAESKGLHFEDDADKASTIEVGVGTGHGRHHHGPLGARKRRVHRGRTHLGHHRHLHRGMRRAFQRAAPHGKAVDDPASEVDEILARGDVGMLLEGLLEALNEVIDNDATDGAAKVANIAEIFDDFLDEAEGMGIDVGDESTDTDEAVGKAVQELLATKSLAPALGTSINNALIRARKETHMPDENDRQVEGKSSKEFEEMQKQLSGLLEEKKALDLEKRAQVEAEKALAAEVEAKRLADEQAVADAKALDEKVQEAVARMRANTNTGTRFVAPAAVSTGSTTDYKTMGAWLRDIKAAKRGDHNAFDRLSAMETKAASEWGTDTKAVGEATNAGGGYLVPPQYWQQGLAEFRIAVGKLRALCTELPAGSDLVLLPRETGLNTVGWVAEGATKPSTDQTFGQLSIGIFPLAGITKVSNQMLQDSTPAVDAIAKKDLGRTIGQAEDIAFINGSGSNQPLGILNTPGVLSLAVGTGSLGKPTADAISAAITAIQSNFFGDPDAVLAHPRDIQKLRNSTDANGRYLLEPAFYPAGTPNAGGATALLGANVTAPSPVGMMWGLPIYSDANIPTNLGAGTNETRVIVANFKEDYVLDREAMRIDVSSEAGTSFEQNQTWFRGEERLGFTAGRQPTANCFITGLTPTAG